jgi:hypothetical protein
VTVPIIGLRLQAYHLLALAIKADEEGRSSDAYELTAKAIHHLEDATSVDELRGNLDANGAASGKQFSNVTPLR